MENKTNQAASTEPKKETIVIPTQKTFKFWFWVSQEKIDAVVNKWLEDNTRGGRPAMLGKVCSNILTGQIIYVFMFSTIKPK
jgi:hypothetical protein